MAGRTSRFIAAAALVGLFPASAAAVQAHGDAEGLFVHQLSHLFFILSMGGLAYWIGRNGLAGIPGWRSIRASALLFLLWSLDAFLVHAMDAAGGWGAVRSAGPGHLEIADPFAFLSYLARMDHLLLVPALFMFHRGLRRMVRKEGTRPEAA